MEVRDLLEIEKLGILYIKKIEQNCWGGSLIYYYDGEKSAQTRMADDVPAENKRQAIKCQVDGSQYSFLKYEKKIRVEHLGFQGCSFPTLHVGDIMYSLFVVSKS